jgi:hypothetical protein
MKSLSALQQKVDKKSVVLLATSLENCWNVSHWEAYFPMIYNSKILNPVKAFPSMVLPVARIYPRMASDASSLR